MNVDAGTVMGAVVLLLALYLAFRAVEAVLKVLLWALVLAAGYALAAPALGWPGVPELLGAILGAAPVEQVREWLSALWDALPAPGSPPPD